MRMTKWQSDIRNKAEQHELKTLYYGCNQQLCFDCYISTINGIPGYGQSAMFGTSDQTAVTAISSAMSVLFAARNQTDQAQDAAIHERPQDLQKLLGKNVVKYIPFQSKLQKDLRRARKKKFKHLTPIIGAYSTSPFGMFYLEPDGQNRVLQIIQDYDNSGK